MTILRVHLPLTRVLLNSRDQVHKLLTTNLHKFQILSKINQPQHSKTQVLHYQKKVLAPYLLMLQTEVHKTRLKLRMLHQTS
jgi:hypothetical protein